jgi:hypothetical protein
MVVMVGGGAGSFPHVRKSCGVNVCVASSLLYDGLPTKYNLFVHGSLRHDSILCSAGCNVVEDVHHLFLNCPLSSIVWYDIISWLVILFVLPGNAIDLTSQFCGVHNFYKSSRPCLQVIYGWQRYDFFKKSLIIMFLTTKYFMLIEWSSISKPRVVVVEGQEKKMLVLIYIIGCPTQNFV